MDQILTSKNSEICKKTKGLTKSLEKSPPQNENQLQKFVKNFQINSQKTKLEWQKKLQNFQIIKRRSRRHSDSIQKNDGFNIFFNKDLDENCVNCNKQVQNSGQEYFNKLNIMFKNNPLKQLNSEICTCTTSNFIKSQPKVLKDRVANVVNRLKNANFQISKDGYNFNPDDENNNIVSKEKVKIINSETITQATVDDCSGKEMSCPNVENETRHVSLSKSTKHDQFVKNLKQKFKFSKDLQPNATSLNKLDKIEQANVQIVKPLNKSTNNLIELNEDKKSKFVNTFKTKKFQFQSKIENIKNKRIFNKRNISNPTFSNLLSKNSKTHSSSAENISSSSKILNLNSPVNQVQYRNSIADCVDVSNSFRSNSFQIDSKSISFTRSESICNMDHFDIACDEKVFQNQMENFEGVFPLQKSWSNTTFEKLKSDCEKKDLKISYSATEKFKNWSNFKAFRGENQCKPNSSSKNVIKASKSYSKDLTISLQNKRQKIVPTMKKALTTQKSSSNFKSNFKRLRSLKYDKNEDNQIDEYGPHNLPNFENVCLESNSDTKSIASNVSKTSTTATLPDYKTTVPEFIFQPFFSNMD